MSEYIYGKNSVASLLQAHKEIEMLYIQTGRNNDAIEQTAIKNGVVYKMVDRKYLDKLVAGNHQGYVAQVKEYKTYTIDEILETINSDKPLLIALDGIQDPHNLGAILRSAACVGADGVIIEKNRSVSLNGTVAKVSVGAIDKVKVASVTNLTNTLKYLKEKGYWIVGSDMNSSDYRTVDYNIPVVLVIGSEGEGMHRLVKQNCDFTISLPMFNEMDSLNASVAAGIMLYEIYNQRHPVK